MLVATCPSAEGFQLLPTACIAMLLLRLWTPLLPLLFPVIPLSSLLALMHSCSYILHMQVPLCRFGDTAAHNFMDVTDMLGSTTAPA